MKNKLNLVIAITALMAVFFLNSCKKEELGSSSADSKKQAETFTKATNATVKDMQYLMNAQNMALGVIQQINGTFKTSGDGFGNEEFPCATLTQDTLSSPRWALIDLGAGCQSASSGEFQSGSIYIEYTNPDLDGQPGDYIRITVTNFITDTDTTNGIILFTYNGLNGNGNRVVHASTNITTGNKLDEIQFTGINDFDIEAIQDTTGGNSLYNLSITGSGSGNTSDGLSFTQTVTTPLNWSLNQCEFFVSGILDIQTQGQPDKQVNFGTGACDNQAIVRESGTSYPITLVN